MASIDKISDVETFVDETLDELSDNVRTFKRAEFVGMPTDQQRSTLFSMLAAFVESGIPFREAIKFVGTEADAYRLKIALPIENFFQPYFCDEAAAKDREIEGDDVFERAFGKGMVFGEEMIVLRGMIKSSNPVPLLKLAAVLAADANKRQQGLSVSSKRVSHG